MNAMLMFAGLGTRLRPFTDLEPKPLLPIMGRPTAQFAVDALTRAGVDTIVANIHHLPERARLGLAAMDLGGRARARILLSDETAELLGSGGGLRLARPLLGEGAFYLLNADALCDVDLAALARAHARNRAGFGARITLAVHPRSPAGEGYREIFHDGSRVTALGTKTSGRPFFIGAAVIESSALDVFPLVGASEMVPLLLEPAIRDGRAGVHACGGIWHDIGSVDLWRRAHVALIDALETRRLPRAWERRILADNRRVGTRMWVSRRAPRRLDVTGWAGPCYWSPEGNADHADRAPRALGPGAVAYGDGAAVEPGPVAWFRGVNGGVAG